MFKIFFYVNNNIGDNMLYYINVFLIYSILGYIWEEVINLVLSSKISNGFFIGPWIPIYGFGACIIIFVMRFIFNRIKVSRFIKIILLFIISSIILTLMELLGGVFVEYLTGKSYWDYSSLKFNFGHYIALEISLVWGIMSIVVTYLIKPLLDKLIKKIPKYITYIFIGLVILDVLYTIIKEII